jgi:hypothetical protein
MVIHIALGTLLALLLLAFLPATLVALLVGWIYGYAAGVETFEVCVVIQTVVLITDGIIRRWRWGYWP